MFVCHPCPKTGTKAPKLGQRPQNWDKGPRTGLKAQFGGLWAPHDQDYAGRRPALFEYIVKFKRKVFYSMSKIYKNPSILAEFWDFQGDFSMKLP